MDNFINPSVYSPAALYHADSDCLEYVKVDETVFYDRIDDFLTLVKDIETEKTVGFKLKGFKNIFDNQFEELKVQDHEFLVIMRAIENVFTKIGNEAFSEDEKAAYTEAFNMAYNDNVVIAPAAIAA